MLSYLHPFRVEAIFLLQNRILLSERLCYNIHGENFPPLRCRVWPHQRRRRWHVSTGSHDEREYPRVGLDGATARGYMKRVAGAGDLGKRETRKGGVPRKASFNPFRAQSDLDVVCPCTVTHTNKVQSVPERWLTPRWGYQCGGGQAMYLCCENSLRAR